MTEKSFTIDRPTDPGLYESSVLEGLVVIRVNDAGQASALVSGIAATYETAILDFDYYASEYGPFRRLDETEPEPPTPSSTPEPVAPVVPPIAPVIEDLDKELAA